MFLSVACLQFQKRDPAQSTSSVDCDHKCQPVIADQLISQAGTNQRAFDQTRLPIYVGFRAILRESDMYSMADIFHWYLWGTGKDQNLQMHMNAEPGVGMAPGWFLEKGGQYFLVFFGPLIVVGGLGSLWSGPEPPHAGPGAEMQRGWFLQIGGNYLSARSVPLSALLALHCSKNKAVHPHCTMLLFISCFRCLAWHLHLCESCLAKYWSLVTQVLCHKPISTLQAQNMRLSGHYAHAQISDKMRLYDETIKPSKCCVLTSRVSDLDFAENCDGFI